VGKYGHPGAMGRRDQQAAGVGDGGAASLADQARVSALQDGFEQFVHRSGRGVFVKFPDFNRLNRPR